MTLNDLDLLLCVTVQLLAKLNFIDVVKYASALNLTSLVDQRAGHEVMPPKRLAKFYFAENIF